MRDVSGRLKRLERKCRMQSVVLWTCGLLAAGGGLMGLGQDDADPIVLRQLCIVDGDNNIRMHLGTAEDGSAGIRHFDREGNLRLATGETDGLCTSSFFDQDERIVAEFGMHDEGASHLLIRRGVILGPEEIICLDPMGRTRIMLDTDDVDGDAGMHVFDEESRRRIWLGSVGDDGPAIMSLISERGDTRWRAYSEGEDCQVLHFDRNGIDRFGQVTLEGGSAMQLLVDGEGRTRMSLMTTGDGQAYMHAEGVEEVEDLQCRPSVAREEGSGSWHVAQSATAEETP